VQEPNKSGFNWWALLFGPLWYFAKGLWGKGLLLLLVAVVAAGITFMIFGIGGWLVWIWAAAKANEDYYIYWRARQQALGNLPVGGESR
jgi:hypothetical protein